MGCYVLSGESLRVGGKALGTKLVKGVKAVTNEPQFNVRYCIVAWIEKIANGKVVCASRVPMIEGS